MAAYEKLINLSLLDRAIGYIKTLIGQKQDALAVTAINHYGVCSTAAATQAKTVSIPGVSALTEGLRITVLFSAAQTYNGAPTLNVNSLGAKEVRLSTGTKSTRYIWTAGEFVDFIYSGTYWVIVDGFVATTTYYGATKLSASATSTSSALALTPSALNSLVLNMIADAPVYSTSGTYAVGDRVRYSYNLWECNTAIDTAEAWTADHWTKIDPIQEQIDAILSAIGTTVVYSA